MAFTKKIEDFVCEHCGASVKGSGYTNHCPLCLYSKHVDNEPGDRANACSGLMRPLVIINKNGQYTITHQCETCAAEKHNKIAPEDNFDLIIKIASGN